MQSSVSLSRHTLFKVCPLSFTSRQIVSTSTFASRSIWIRSIVPGTNGKNLTTRESWVRSRPRSRRNAKTAGELIESSDHAIALFEDPHAEHITTHQQELVDAEEILQDLHKTSAALQNLGEYIITKFSDPEMQASPEKEEYMSDVKNHLAQAHMDEIILLINHNANKLKIILATNTPSIENISLNPENSTMSDDCDHGDKHQSPNENSAHSEDAVPTDHRESNSSQSSTYHETSSDLPNQLPEPTSINESMLKQAETGNRRLQEEVQRLKLNNEKKLLAQMATEKQRLELEKERLLRQETQMDLATARSENHSKILTNIEHTARHSDPTAISVQTDSNQNIAKDAIVQSSATPIAPTPTSQPNPSYIKDNNTTQANPTSQEMLLINVMNKLSSIEITQNKTNTAIFAEMAKSQAKLETLVDKKLEQRLRDLIKAEDASVTPDGDAENEEHFIEEYEKQGCTADEPSGTSRSNTDKRHRNCSRSRSPSHSHSRHRSRSSHHTDISLDTLIQHIKAFDGTGKLDIFEKTFANSVMKHPKLNDDVRYAILTTLVKGEATPCIDQSTDSKSAIETTLKNLREVYGKCNDKYNLLTKLKQLPFHQSNTRQMRLDVVTHSVVLRQLREKNMSEDDESAIHIIVGKLQPAIRAKLASFLSKMGPRVTQTQVLQRIGQCIDNIEMENTIMSQVTPIAENEVPTSFASIHYARASSYPQNTNGQPIERSDERPQSDRPLAYNPNAYRNSFYDTATKAQLDGIYAPGEKGVNLYLLARSFPFENEEANKCGTCDGMHNPIRCKLSSTAFRKAAAKRGLCPICNFKHDITTCKTRRCCGYCGGLHHMGGCPKKDFFWLLELTAHIRGIPADTGSKVPNPVSQADLPTALCNTSYSKLSAISPLQTAPVVDQLTINCPQTVVTNTFEEYEIYRFVQFVSRTSPPHHITTAVAENIYHRLTFMCLETLDNQNILALVDSGGSLSQVLESKTQQLRLIVLTKTQLSLPGRDSRTNNDSHIVLISDSRVSLKFTIAGNFPAQKKLVRIVTIILSTFSKTLNRKQWEKLLLKQFTATEDPVHQAKVARYLIIRKHYTDTEFIGPKLPFSWSFYKDSSDLYRVDNPVLSQEAHGTILHTKSTETCLRTILRTKYWTAQDEALAKSVTKKCVACNIANSYPFAYPITATLPKCKTTPSKQFSKVDIDCYGPVVYQNDVDKSFKRADGLIYTCSASRGALLRLVPDAIPSETYSDNVGTLKLDAAIINKCTEYFEFSQTLIWFSASESITCRYTTHLAPWQESIYERIVQIVKRQVLSNLLNRHIWPLGVTIKVNKSERDGEIRSAIVKCQGKLIERPVCHLIPLELKSLNHQCQEDKREGTESYDVEVPAEQEPASAENTLSKTALPTTLITLDKKYAPKLFRKNVLPNIAETSAHPADKGTAEDESEDYKQIVITPGESTDLESMTLLEDSYSTEGGVYQDPQNTLPNIVRDYDAENSPAGRSRDYNPRRTKATHINYVHIADIKILSRPSPPECCQLYHAKHSFDNLKAL
ncbi:hypothetical protein CRE_07097 [Caenorhabditis remanei]|uniref:Peptidase aspartic putative domain-containing protein n=1 Tax=Caenorhabditis remanei TaxID=31234 RepID=E3NM50_CAERE|nr:hypothetical protein CRE_07097 [Caenorhabditis remanei]